MKKDILVYGGGGFGREVAWLINEINRVRTDWNMLGFIDDKLEIGTKIIDEYKVLGNLLIIDSFNKETAIAIAIGNKSRIEIARKIINPYVRFPILIHPSVIMSEKVSIGEGTIICAGSIITVDIEIGNFVIINIDCTIGHDAIIEDYCTISPSVNISGNVIIGEKTFIGTGAHIINNVKVGKNVIIGAGSVVTEDIPSDCTVVGIPAKPIKFHNEI